MSSGGGSKEEPEAAFMLAFVAVLMFFVGWGVWHFFKMPILGFMRWVRFGELWIANLFTNHRFDACLDWLRISQYNDFQPPAPVVEAGNACFGPPNTALLAPDDAANYYSLTVQRLGQVERGSMNYLRWPIAAAFFGVAVYGFFYSPRNKFKTTYNIESFIKVQAKMWPVIAPIVNFNPIKSSARIFGSKIPDKLPPFAEALSPEEWISFNRIPVINNIPDREATRRAFLLQLGPRWNGISGQPMHVQALWAAFALKGSQRRDQSDDLLGRISTFWTPKGGLQLDMATTAEIKKLIKDPAVNDEALGIASVHAYRSTAMLSVLLWARRRGGVLAPAQFLWLRGADRTLWYCLNNLGRRAFHTEGAGALAHFMAEQNAKKALPIPRIDTAIVTLNQYLAERGQPIPPRENP